MKAAVTWSAKPYRPILKPAKFPYITRLVPGESEIYFDWLGSEDQEIFWRVRGEELWSRELSSGLSHRICGLKSETDYELRVGEGEIRLFRTGVYPGTVVNYVHPEDDVYAFSGHALCSPSMVRTPQGHLLSSMDLFSSRAPQNLSLIFRSDDDGKTWRYVCDLFPCFWGRLFVHRGRLFIIAVSTEFGDLLIGESADGGETWGMPTVLLRGGCKKDEDGAHRNPQPVVEYGGRLWFSLEWGHSPYAGLHGSIDAEADPMDAENWLFSEPTEMDPTWTGEAGITSKGILEGCMTVCPDGKLRNIYRYQLIGNTPSYGLAVVMDVDTENPEAPETFSRMMSFPGNHSKFMIKRAPGTDKYVSIVSRILGEGCENNRNLLSLVSSTDLVSWELVCDLLDYRDADPKYVGFQYVDFFFEGEDLLWLCRTAINGARNFHDANCQTFHRIENYKELIK
ncbi:MAG: exo-alpha-sialidase [Oscillospiraceae bacterium]|nr:exo-alpha-sialidase [Oscillospiraceae bacterium]